MSADSTSAPAAAAKPELYYVNAQSEPVASPAHAVGIALTAHDGNLSCLVLTSTRLEDGEARFCMFALYGAMALARETVKRNPHAPVAALKARLSAITDKEPVLWGDEKPQKASSAERKALRDAAALEELVDVVRTVKTRLSLAFDEAKFRQRCTTEEGFMRKAKAVADVKAELARRAESTDTSSTGVEAL